MIGAPARYRSASRTPDRPAVDGRFLRSERTRQRIVEAYLDLLRENSQVPTTSQIADRAGCSLRSVFERFADLLSLRLAAADYVVEQGLTLAPARHVDGDRHTRLRSQVETRAQTCERWLPLWRALSRNRDDSPELKTRLDSMYAVIVARLELMYRPELSTLPEPERERTLIALKILTEFESWGQMREHHGLSVDAACAVWISAIDRLLPPTPESA